MPGGQPFAAAICTIGMSFLPGSGSEGFGPRLDVGEGAGPRSVGPSLHAVSAISAAAAKAAIQRRLFMEQLAGGKRTAGHLIRRLRSRSQVKPVRRCRKAPWCGAIPSWP
jgi:hypothetical protein